jgi:hypothetical protein
MILFAYSSPDFAYLNKQNISILTGIRYDQSFLRFREKARRQSLIAAIDKHCAP